MSRLGDDKLEPVRSMLERTRSGLARVNDLVLGILGGVHGLVRFLARQRRGESTLRLDFFLDQVGS